MPNAKEEYQNRIKTLCLFCGEEVERKQLINCKAVCEECDMEVFGTEIPKPITVKDYREQKRKQEEEVFIKMMKKLMFKVKR